MQTQAEKIEGLDSLWTFTGGCELPNKHCSWSSYSSKSLLPTHHYGTRIFVDLDLKIEDLIPGKFKDTKFVFFADLRLRRNIPQSDYVHIQFTSVSAPKLRRQFVKEFWRIKPSKYAIGVIDETCSNE